MSYYYKYNFTSPEPIYALVKEELKSYFEAGAIDDVLFSLYTNKCLKKLGKGTYKILPTILSIENFTSVLPLRFHSVREAWMCITVSQAIPIPGTTYNQVDQISTLLSTGEVDCNRCIQNPDMIKLVYKTNSTILAQYQITHLLQPGNISASDACSLDSLNKGVICGDTFDIRDGKFVTNFRDGIVHLIYYSNEIGEDGYQLVPDDYYIQEYIAAFLKAKMYEQLSNQVTDETYNQIQNKAQEYIRKADEAFVVASTEAKKETIERKVYGIGKSRRRFNKYIIK